MNIKVLNKKKFGIKKNTKQKNIIHVDNVCAYRQRTQTMAFPVVEFSKKGYKIRKVFG